MAEITPVSATGHTREPFTTRRLIGLERHYRCRSCGSEPRSWARLAACPDCGHMFMTAVIRRAALAE
jgi:predicted RNA-binding Zn-ribbon protein involved in translation (DUF1610 family)